STHTSTSMVHDVTEMVSDQGPGTGTPMNVSMPVRPRPVGGLSSGSGGACTYSVMAASTSSSGSGASPGSEVHVGMRPVSNTSQPFRRRPRMADPSSNLERTSQSV